MFLTLLNILNIVFKYSINYVNFTNKVNSFLINYLVINSWFYSTILFIKYNSFFYKTMLIDINSFDFLKNIQINSKKSLNINILIYSFYLFYYNIKLNFIVFFSKNMPVSTISNLFISALWVERELSEMFGYNFLNKIDSRNLLLDYSYIGHPLLKSFPVVGNIEIYYNFLKN